MAKDIGIDQTSITLAAIVWSGDRPFWTRRLGDLVTVGFVIEYDGHQHADISANTAWLFPVGSLLSIDGNVVNRWIRITK